MNNLGGQYPILILDCDHCFGAPYRAVRLFGCDPSMPSHLEGTLPYSATTSRVPYSWIEDIKRGRPGYFLTGLAPAPDLWQIVSCEPDPADRCVFVLSPVRLPHGLPTPNFNKIKDPLLRGEAEQHWTNRRKLHNLSRSCLHQKRRRRRHARLKPTGESNFYPHEHAGEQRRHP